MMGIVLPEAEVRTLLRDGLCVGALNGPEITVVSGPVAAVEAIQAQMAARGVVVRRLDAARHAFHSTWMEPVAERLAGLLRGVRLSAPKIPFVSNVTGTWITPEEATDPAYWTRHLCGTVRFSEGVETLARAGHRVLLEVGPGHVLRALAIQHPAWAGSAPTIVASLRHDYERHPDAAHLLGAAGRLWTAGVAVDWKGVHGHGRRRRVPLPTYPFERTRYRIDRLPGTTAEARGGDPLARRADPAEWLHAPAWTRAPLAPPPHAGPDAGSWLVLADGLGIGAGLAEGLRALGHDVAVARAGGQFARGADGTFTVRPGAAPDLLALRDALGTDGTHPRHVVQLWGLDPEVEDGAEAFAQAQARGYASVAAVAAAFARDRAGGPLRLVVVTEGVQDVSGGEGVRPERATVLGACLVLPHEHPHVSCRTVDIRRSPRDDGGRLLRQLLAEAVADGAAPVAALRGALRWARGWQAVRAPEGAGGLREGGAYLFCGSLAAGGDVLAEHLARTLGARVAVALDPAFPETGAWDAHLAAAAPGDHVAATIRWIRAAQARDGAPLLLRAAPGDAAQLRAALAQARAAFGALHGVVHTGRLGAAAELTPLAQSRPGPVAADLARTAQELAALRQATDGAGLDFVLVQGSIVSAFGGPGLAGPTAAAALADACAQGAAAEGAPWTSVGWDRWELDVPDTPDARAGSGGGAIFPSDGVRVFAALAALGGEPRVAVSTHDLGARIARFGAPRAGAGTAPAGEAPLHARPARAGTLHPPTTVAEEILVEVWRELLGIGGIGVRDDFFHLGGHSLLGMQVVSRIRDAFQVDLPLAAIFQAPTIAGLAQMIDQAVLLELEAMSEDEALALAESSVA